MGVDVFVGYTGWVMIDYLIVRGLEPGPQFLFADRRPLTRPRFVENIRAALWKAGIDGAHYSGHSCAVQPPKQ